VRLFARLAVAVSLAAGGVAVVGSPATANGCAASQVEIDAVTIGTNGYGGVVAGKLQITNEAQLLKLAVTSGDWGKHFVQTQPIDLTGCTWTPIGRGFPQGQGSSDPFTGSYDGGNKTITGLTINLQAEDGYVGMFGYADGATLSAISLVGADVTGYNKVGALVGEMKDGTVTNSSVTGSVSGNDWVGGLVGYNFGGSISKSHSSALVDGTETVGGLVGSNDGGTISRSFATGAVSGDDEVGGLVGLNEEEALVENSFARGAVTGGTSVGGLVGSNNYDATIRRSYATGTVIGTGDVGGLVGNDDDDGMTELSFWDQNTSGQLDSAGGTGKTTDQMKQLGTFTEWSIEAACEPSDDQTVWGLCATKNNGYPFLFGVYVAQSQEQTDNNIDNNNTGGETVTVVDTAPSTTVPVTTVPVTTVPAPVVPVPVGGVLPQNPPGVATVFENGQPVAVETFVEDDIELVVRASTFELRLGGECAQACTIRATDDGRQVLELEANGSARVEGEGFLAGSTVDVWLFSEPKYLGQLTVGADGRFAGSVALGNIEVGEHTLQVNGLSPDGVQRSANLGVVVAPALTPTLPATGGDPVGLWALALAMFGVGLVLSVRRRALPPR
jgi:hypothetical protein